MVLDLATQWIQSYPCQKLHMRRKRIRKSSSSRRRNQGFFFKQTFLQNFVKSCEEFSWNHRTSTRHRSGTIGIAERAVRRVKKGTSAVLLQAGLDEKWLTESMECFCNLRNVQDLLADGKNFRRMTILRTLPGTDHSIWSDGRVSSDFNKRSIQTSPIWEESLTWNISWICIERGKC